ncbi:hypothetical protein TNCV_140651 [Trichonephila clavipes]|nr:hypothetical protein TNCV_140651 [Trichonephila clavipes]
MLTKQGFIIREIRKQVVMTVLMRQYMRESDRVIGLIGRTRKNPDVLENPRNENKNCNWEPEVFPGPSNQGTDEVQSTQKRRAVEKQVWSLTRPERPGQKIAEDTV